MAIEITIPRLGWSMEQGTFGEWLKTHGDKVSLGDAVFALESDKALQEVESIDEGVLHILAPGPSAGDTVEVGQVIGYLLAEGETPPAFHTSNPQQKNANVFSAPPPLPHVPSSTPTPSPSASKNTKLSEEGCMAPAAAGPAVRRLAMQLGIDWRSIPVRGTLSKNDLLRFMQDDSTPPPDMGTIFPTGNSVVPQRNSDSGFPRLTPRAYRTARQLGIDWTLLRGTGRHGRIREQDVLSAPARSNSTHPSPLRQSSGTLEPASRIRRATNQRLQESQRHTIPVTLTAVAEASDLVDLRAEMKQQGFDPLPSYNDMIMKIVANALKECPSLNACWQEEGLWIYDEINLAMAIQSPTGLTAPVIQNADQLSLSDLTSATRSLIDLTTNGGLRREHLDSGTFTITNLGMYDIEHFTPVIAYPQSAILGVGKLAAAPIIREDSIVPGYRLPLSLTFDHQATDGAPAAQWLQQLCQRIETARQELVSSSS
jgi:pyruvate dehydrogenase E2 component (dihydrolipoamide acetyltransferase)